MCFVDSVAEVPLTMQQKGEHAKPGEAFLK